MCDIVTDKLFDQRDLWKAKKNILYFIIMQCAHRLNETDFFLTQNVHFFPQTECLGRRHRMLLPQQQRIYECAE